MVGFVYILGSITNHYVNLSLDLNHFLRLRKTQNAYGQARKSFFCGGTTVLLSMTCVTKIGPVSLGTLANGLMVVILDVGGQYLFNMHVEFNT